MSIWQLQEAKNKFNELIQKAQVEGPQTITKHGMDAVVVLSIADYKSLLKPNSTLVEFMANSPLAECETVSFPDFRHCKVEDCS